MLGGFLKEHLGSLSIVFGRALCCVTKRKLRKDRYYGSRVVPRDEGENGLMSKLGRRYVCTRCGQTLLCLGEGHTEAEDGGFQCCGQVMETVEIAEIPTSD